VPNRQAFLIGGVAVATAGAAASHYLHSPALLAFGIATIALAGLAWVVSVATEQLGSRLGPAATGVLQSTLGNLPEFFVVIFALRAGKTLVAQTSLVGSILANALLVLGLAIIAGSTRARDGIMRFQPRLPQDTATLLLLANFIIVLVGLSTGAGDLASHHIKAISVVGSLCLLVVYLTWLIPYVRSPIAAEEVRQRDTHSPLVTAAVLLAVAGVASAFVSDWFVAALTPAMDKLHLSDAFAGLVVVAIAGNAVENVAGIALAAKGQSDLAISVIKNSVAQVAAFLFPLLVLVSLLFEHTLTYKMAPVLIGALGLTAISIWQITGDGESTVFEGTALVALYVIVATVTLFE
jgi:Ca2+:H+ antiporter